MVPEIDAKRDGCQGLEVHLHNHAPPPPAKEILTQTVRDTLAAVRDKGAQSSSIPGCANA